MLDAAQSLYLIAFHWGRWCVCDDINVCVCQGLDTVCYMCARVWSQRSRKAEEMHTHHIRTEAS